MDELDVRDRNKIEHMAILVNLFAGDSTAIRRCLDSGGWPPKLPTSKCAEEVGFKFGIMPEQAFDALIVSAVRLAKVQPFSFGDCVSGRLAQDGESFQGTVNGRFIELFSKFPESQIQELSAHWTAEIGSIYDAEFPPVQRRKRTWVDRVGSVIQAAIFGTVMFPILAIAHLSPSFRRDRAQNKKKLAEWKRPAPQTNQELLASLLRVCTIARDRNDVVVYTWNI